MTPENLPATIATFLRHNPSARDLVTWWEDGNSYFVLELDRSDNLFTLWLFPLSVGHWGHDVAEMGCPLAEMDGLLNEKRWGMPENIKTEVARLVADLGRS